MIRRKHAAVSPVVVAPAGIEGEEIDVVAYGVTRSGWVANVCRPAGGTPVIIGRRKNLRIGVLHAKDGIARYTVFVHNHPVG